MNSNWSRQERLERMEQIVNNTPSDAQVIEETIEAIKLNVESLKQIRKKHLEAYNAIGQFLKDWQALTKDE